MQTIRLPTGTFDYDPASPLGPVGGFGTVFAGRAADGSEVAVKKLHLSAAEAAHRELDIARELQGMKFQHVIGFIDAGSDAETGVYFVVMPRAEFSLQQKIRSAGFDLSAVVDVLHQIAVGLTEVPTIVHRDLKPGNVLWHENRWKIADFGIARFVEDATSSQTLKGCLSALYAAPEQWRYERATNATDVYALGCIAFELLAGTPPFTTDPEKQHQTEPLPAFSCADARLCSLLSLMTRKTPAARPSITRVQRVLREIIAAPAALKAGALSDLANVGAAVAIAAQKAESETAAVARAERERVQLHVEAQEILYENISRLWEKIHSQAPAAQRTNGRRNPCFIQVRLGGAVLEIGRILAKVVSPQEFEHSGWDVVSSSTVTVTNGSSRVYKWEVSLWYVKQPNESDYRWVEVGYFSPFQSRMSPFSAHGYQEADFAASRINGGVYFAWGPTPIDGEHENEFHERCIWLFAKAANGLLREPSNKPIQSWPPQM